MYHVSPWTVNQHHDSFVAEGTKVEPAVPTATMVTLKRYATTDLRELRMNYKEFSFKMFFSLTIQFLKYNSWTPFY